MNHMIAAMFDELEKIGMSYPAELGKKGLQAVSKAHINLTARARDIGTQLAVKRKLPFKHVEALNAHLGRLQSAAAQM